MNDESNTHEANSKPRWNRFVAWVMKNAKTLGALLFLTVLILLGLAGLGVLDRPRSNVQICNQYCSPLLRGIDDKTAEAAAQDWKRFEGCRLYCAQDRHPVQAVERYFKNKKLQNMEVDRSLLVRLADNQSQVLQHLFSLLQSLSLLFVLGGAFGIVVFLGHFFFSKIIDFGAIFNTENAKTVLGSLALAATTASAGFVAAKASDPPDLTALNKQAAALESKLVEVDARIDPLNQQIDKVRENLSTNLELSNVDILTRLDKIQTRLGEGAQPVAQELEQIQSTLRTQTVAIESLREQVRIHTAAGPPLGGNNDVSNDADIQQILAEIKRLESSLTDQRDKIQKISSDLNALATVDKRLGEVLNTWTEGLKANTEGLKDTKDEIRKLRRQGIQGM